MYKIRYHYKGAPDFIMNTISALGEVEWGDLVAEVKNEIDKFSEKRKYSPQGHIKNTINRLVKNGYLAETRRGKKQYYLLTVRGERRLEKGILRTYSFDKKWDGKWRVIIFDIKETNRKTRNLLRNELMAQSFIKLQNSVWVFPYECYEYVNLLKNSFSLYKSTLYMVAETLENEDWLKQRFNL